MINPRGGLSVCTKSNWRLSKGYPAISSATILLVEMGKEVLMLCRHVGQTACTLTLLATKNGTQFLQLQVHEGPYASRNLLELRSSPSCVKGAIKSWCAGRCSCVARLQVAALWKVANQKFGACAVFWVGSSAQLFWGTWKGTVSEMMFMGLCVQNNLVFCSTRFHKFS